MVCTANRSNTRMNTKGDFSLLQRFAVQTVQIQKVTLNNFFSIDLSRITL